MTTPPAVRVWGSSFALYKQIWRSNLFGSLLQPVLYLLGIGVGVGSLVDEGATTDVLGVDYVAFLGPALLATTAMIVVAQEAMWPVYDGLTWSNAYRAMAATPLRAIDVVSGVALWHATRAFIAAAGVAVVLAFVPATRSWGLVPAVPFAVLTGMAVAGPIMAWSSSRESGEQSFPAIMRFVVVPMFLFAGAFYPITQLPGWMQVVARATPLYHGVELCRGAVLHTLGLADTVIHVGVLLAYWGIGVALSGRTFAAAVGDMSMAEVTTHLRIIPPAILEARRPQRLIERSLMVNRRTWLIVVSGFFEPLFYLLSIQVGFGDLVGDVTVDGESIPYAEFVAPALLAASAMNGAVYENTMNVFFKMKHQRLYDAVLATPLVPGDVALGEIGWAQCRGLIYSVAFLLTMWALGMTGSPWIVLAVPACALIGFAFGAMGMALTTYMRSWADFEYVTALTLPLFLFSATFYPVSSYGDWGWLVQLSPLYHGVAIVRALNLGVFEWSMLGHIAVLVALSLVGLAVTSRRIGALLLK